MGDFIKAIVLFIILIHSSSVFSREIYVSQNVDFADQLIEKGATNTAYFILKKELKNKNYSSLDKYKITKLISRCFLKELDMYHYDEFNRKGYELVKEEGEIYKAQFYIERVYFFHNLTWGDSVMYYATRAKEIFDRNRKDWNKIDVPFFFRIYGGSFLYTKNDVNVPIKQLYNMPKSRYRMLKFMDSSFVLAKKYPYQYQSDLALAYRGIGNRHLDMVSEYHYPTKWRPYRINKLGWYCFYKAKRAYEKANSLLDKKNQLERVANYSLLALNYMCIGKPFIAQKYFDTMHKIYFSENHKSISAPKVYLNCLTYERLNDFNLKYNPKKNQEAIQRLEAILPQWFEFLKSNGRYTYDTYYFSPYLQLYCYYARKFLHTNDQKDIFKAVQYLLTEKNHFKYINESSNTEKYRWIAAKEEWKHFSKNELKQIKSILKKEPVQITNTNTHYPLIDLNFIQKKLKADEAILVSYMSKVFLDDYKIILTRNKIQLFKSKNDQHDTENPDYEKWDFKTFKTWTFKQYYTKLFRACKMFSTIKKFYILYDDDTNYELMITRLKGKSYNNLPFAMKKYAFIKLYDVENYFKSQMKGKRNVEYLKLQTTSQTQLPFMEQFNPKQFFKGKVIKKVTTTDFSTEIKKNGILHLVGHGDLQFVDSANFVGYNNFLVYLKNGIQKIDKLNLKIPIHRDLLIFDNCYSGFRVGYKHEFDRGMYLELMRKGAVSMVVNKDKVDDYVSSQIMKHFYTYLNKGIPVGEALVYAKRKFLKENQNGYANPMYWSPFFAISSRKVRF
jgi:hypothetical protein